MSRKTRAQKIIIQLRRQVKIAKAEKKPVVTVASHPVPQIEKQPEPYSKTTIPTLAALPMIKKDIIKTLFLTVLIISLQLILYWSLELGGNQVLTKFLPK